MIFGSQGTVNGPRGFTFLVSSSNGQECLFVGQGIGSTRLLHLRP